MDETHDDGDNHLVCIGINGMGGYEVAITHWNCTTDRHDDDPAGGFRTDEHQIKNS